MGPAVQREQSVIGDVILVARTEIRRTVRKMLGNWVKLLLVGVAALFFLGPILLLGTVGLATVGTEAASGGLELPGETTVLDVVTGASATLLFLFLFIATMRAATNVVVLDEPEFLLLSTPLSAVVGGLVLAEFLLFSLWVLPPAVVLSVAFAYGAGSFLPVVVGPLVVATILAMAVAVGFLLGLCVRHLVTVYEPIATYRTPLAVVLGVGYVALFALELAGPVMEAIYTILGDSPVGWPGYLLVVAVPGVPTTVFGVVGAIATIGVVLAGALGVATWVGGYHWFAESARTETETTSERVSMDVLERGLDGVISRPVRVVTLTTLTRAKRAPIRLLYVAYPLFGTLYTVEDIVQSGTIPPYVAVLLCLYVVWGTGALFSLNPLGDLGPALPTVLTSSASGRDIVLGVALSGVLVGVPLAAFVSLVAGLVSPLSVGTTALLVGVTLVGALCAPALATGIGTLFPRFGAVRVATNRKEVMPSKTAFLVYSLVVVLSAAGATLLVATPLADIAADALSWLLSLFPVVEVSVPVSVVKGLSTLVVAVWVFGSVLAGWFAARSIDAYRLD